MNKKKLLILSAAVAMLVLALVLMVMRGGGEKNPDNTHTSTLDTKAVSKKEMENIITKVIHNETITGEELPMSQQYANAILNAISYEIIESDEFGKAVVKFTYIDAMKMADTYGTVSNSDDFYAFCIQQIQNNVAPLVEATIEVEYRAAADGSVEIVDSIAFADVLTGGAASEFLKLLEGR